MYALKVDWKHVSSSFKEISCRGAEFSKATFVSFLIFFIVLQMLGLWDLPYLSYFPTAL